MLDVLQLIGDAYEVQRQLRERRTNLPEGKWPWRMSDKVRIVLQPHVLCPSEECGDAVETPWLLVLLDDGGRSRVLDVYEEQASGWINITHSWEHPHVDTKNRVCMGDAADVVQALTLGLNPDSAYCGHAGVQKWFRELHHHCDWSDPRRRCYCCEEDFDEEEDDIHFYSGLDEWLCARCFRDNYFTCRSCEDTLSNREAHYGPDDEVYCESCLTDLWTFCGDCDELEDRTEVVEVREPISGGTRMWSRYVCRGCIEEHYTACAHCNNWRRTEDLVEVESSGNLYCSGCVPEPEEGGGDD